MMEILNVFIGALIALISSILTTIILVNNQRKNDNIKRKWELSNLAYEEEKRIYFLRFQQLEDYANVMALAVHELQKTELDVIHGKKTGQFKFSPDLTSFFDHKYIMGLIDEYGDKELYGLFSELLSCLEIIFAQLNQNIFSDEVSNLKQSEVSFLNLYGKIIKKIDQLRIAYIKTNLQQ